MKKIFVASASVLILLAYIGLSVYAISTQEIERLLICADHGGLKIPFSKNFCREYLFAFRGSREDVDALHQRSGALFVVQGKSTVPEREKALKFLIGKGLDVNRVGMGNFLPLHGAVSANAADEVKMLLDNGANPSLKDENFLLTPMELALKLQSEHKLSIDRAAVIALLRNANSNAQPIIPPEVAR